MARTHPIPTLKKRADFLALRGGRRWRGAAFTLETKPRKAAKADRDRDRLTRASAATSGSAPREPARPGQRSPPSQPSPTASDNGAGTVPGTTTGSAKPLVAATTAKAALPPSDPKEPPAALRALETTAARGPSPIQPCAEPPDVRSTGPATDASATDGPRSDTIAAARQTGEGTALGTAVGPHAAAPTGPRVGFTVTKRLGNAVARNRIRRRLKEAARALDPDGWRADHDYVIIAHPSAATRAFAALVEDLAAALAHVHRVRHADTRPDPPTGTHQRKRPRKRRN